MPRRAHRRCSSYRAEPLESRVLLAKAVAYFPDWEYTGGLLNKIDLSAIDANSTHAGNDAFAFIGAEDFHYIAGELRAVFDGDAWRIEGDIDGNGVADFVLAVTTANGHALGVTDFTL